jgi:hypothetical protein
MRRINVELQLENWSTADKMGDRLREVHIYNKMHLRGIVCENLELNMLMNFNVDGGQILSCE